jgi:hypothetical protein
MNTLVWEIENFDYFSTYCENSVFNKNNMEKQNEIIIAIEKCNNKDILKICLHILPKIDNPFKHVLQNRLRKLNDF